MPCLVACGLSPVVREHYVHPACPYVVTISFAHSLSYGVYVHTETDHYRVTLLDSLHTHCPGLNTPAFRNLQFNSEGSFSTGTCPYPTELKS